VATKTVPVLIINEMLKAALVVVLMRPQIETIHHKTPAVLACLIWVIVAAAAPIHPVEAVVGYTPHFID